MHSPNQNYLFERILAVSFYDSAAGPLGTGNYAIQDSAGSNGKYLDATIYIADSTHSPYSIFRGKQGNFTLSIIDTCAGHFEGQFEGIFVDISDTTKHIQILNGAFSVDYVSRYFVIP